MKKNNLYLTAGKYVTICMFLLVLPLNVYSSELFHTIQTSSFSSVKDAQKQFDSIVNKLDETQLDNLRIEKIGKYYSVRLGKYMDYKSAESFFSTVKPKLPNAAVMKAYIKKKRIVKLYSDSAYIDIEHSENKPSTVAVPDTVQSQTTRKLDEKETVITMNESLKNIEALVGNNDYAAALDITTSKITEQPEHPAINAWHGMVLLKMDKASESLQYLEKATELSPDAPDYHNGLGYSYFFLNRYKEAIDEFNKAISLDPGHFDAFTGLGIAYAKNNNTEEAMDIYHKIKLIDKETSKQLLAVIEK